MSLVDVERAVARICLVAQPDESDLALLGERRRWLLYREMVRDRLFSIVGTALPRTKETLGADFPRWTARWLAEEPPRTRFFREVVERFCEFVEPRLGEPGTLLGDLVVFERAVWEVGYAPTEARPVVDFDFERPMVLSSAVRSIVLSHAVHEAAPYAEGTVRLLVYRKPTTNTAAWRAVNETTAALFAEWAKGEVAASEGVRRVAAARGIGIDQKFLEGLGTVVAELIEAGVILGSVP
jgi:hypothetical protein